jgi:3',5'-cyclic AMP phosphodiesterase CpdA
MSFFPPPKPDVSASPLSRRSLLTKFAAVTGLCAAPVIGEGSAKEPASRGFRFAFLTDIHIDRHREAPRGVRECISAVNALAPSVEFVLTGGDLIMDALAVDADSIREQWRLFDEEWKNLRVKSYHTIGNHDIGGWAKDAKVAASEPEYGKELFAGRYGNGGTYQSFDHLGWHFIVLDSVAYDETTGGYQGWIDDAQLEWLKADLLRVGKTTPVIISTHIPFFSVWGQYTADPRKGESRGGVVGNAHLVRKVLSDYNVKLVLCGHGHVSERIELSHHNRTTYIQGGAAGSWKSRGIWFGLLLRGWQLYLRLSVLQQNPRVGG